MGSNQSNNPFVGLAKQACAIAMHSRLVLDATPWMRRPNDQLNVPLFHLTRIQQQPATVNKSNQKKKCYFQSDTQILMTLFIHTSGNKKFGRNVVSNCKRCNAVLALFAFSNSERILRLCRIGTSDINSTPPATIISYVPDAIRPTPVVIAWFALMHAIVTVCAGVLLLKPAANAASRPIFDVFTSWITVPYTM